MKLSKHLKINILGGGIAGTTLAYQLMCQQHPFTLYRGDIANSSSIGAAGIFNPITGRHFSLTWNAHSLWKKMYAYYREVENTVNDSFFHETPTFRVFKTMDQKNDWEANAQDSRFANFLSEPAIQTANLPEVKAPFGGLMIRKSGYLNLPKYLSQVHALLHFKGLLIEEEYQEDFNPDEIYIHCTGRLANESPLWSALPFRPVKGEILNIQMDSPLPYILNNSGFVLPTKDQSHRVGATYHHQNLNRETTEKGRLELLDKMVKMGNFKFNITDQWAGIRPATADRRPILGQHPTEKNHYIFNGLGSKGVSLAPWCSVQLMGLLFQDQPVPAEISIERYTKNSN